MAVPINAIFKQVGVEPEMCSDTYTDGRIFQSLFYFILIDYIQRCNQILVFIFAMKLLEIVRWIPISFNSVITSRENYFITVLLSKLGEKQTQMQACLNIDFKIFNIPCVSKLATTGLSPSSQFSLQAYTESLTQWNIIPSKYFQTVDKT